jgi:hypothetical protein
MLVVLSVLPLSETVCAITCNQAAHSESPDRHHHHEAGLEASQPAAPDVPLISGPTAHPCDHIAAIPQATTAAQKGPIAVSTPPASMVAVDAFAAPLVQRVRTLHGAPPGSTPPTSTPLVLRV